jgi:hypothetical protein
VKCDPAHVATALVDAGANAMTIAPFAEAAGAPGTVLPSTTIYNLPTVNPARVTANFGGAVLLSANTTYWLMAYVSGDSAGA